MIERTIKIIRILTIVAFIILAYLAITYKFGDCDTCKFKYGEKELSARDFMSIYTENCTIKSEQGYVPFNLSMLESSQAH